MSSRNTIYLVCEAHQEVTDALRLGERFASGYRDAAKHADRWFATHATCGHGDHFKLAYARPQGWDHSPPADPVAAGVRVALATEGLH